MAKKTDKSNGTPAGWIKVERKLRPFWIPMPRENTPENALTDFSVEGVIVGKRTRKSELFDKDQDMLDLDTEDGAGATVTINGNLGFLLKEARVKEGDVIRIEYAGFIQPDKKRGLPQGMHEYRLYVRDAG